MLQTASLTWVKVFRISPEFRILRLTFCMLNKGDHKSFSGLFYVCLRTSDHLNLKSWIFSGHIASNKIESFLKFRILEIFNFHPCFEPLPYSWHLACWIFYEQYSSPMFILFAYSIPVVSMCFHLEWKTVRILIRWLHQKPAIGKSRPNSRIKPRMYVRRSIMYEKAAFC